MFVEKCFLCVVLPRRGCAWHRMTPVCVGTWVTLEDKQRLAEQRAAENAERRADFNATNN